MTLQEEWNIQGQQGTQSYLTQERQNLSASVKETLANASAEDVLPGKQDDAVSFSQFVHNALASLIPPRLSLQSKEMSSARPGDFVQLATETQLQSYANLPQDGHGNATTPVIVDAIPTPRAVDTRPQPVRSKRRFGGRTRKIKLETVANEGEQGREMQGVERELHIHIPQTDALALSEALKGMRKMQGVERGLREPMRVDVHPYDVAQQKTKPDLMVAPPAVQAQEEMREVRTQISDTDALVLPDELKGTRNRAGSAVPYTANFGTGVFESRQSEVMVANKEITPSSVVHVVLTAYPGPTMVQYVSLHPQLGFTVHLTAPADTKTPFSYVIFSSASC